MLLAIVDTETTDVTYDAKIIEVACILFHVESKTVLQSLSTLVYSDQKNKGFKKNKISEEALEFFKSFLSGYEISFMGMIFHSMRYSDYIVAHNAEFDKQFFESIHKPWLCTQQDFKFPDIEQGLSLLNLANEHNIPIWGNHRALNDCQLIANIFQTYEPETLLELIKYAAEPSVIIVADVSYQDRHLASESGFKWDRIVPKKWAKKIKRSEYEDLVNDLDFRISIWNHARMLEYD